MAIPHIKRAFSRATHHGAVPFLNEASSPLSQRLKANLRFASGQLRFASILAEKSRDLSGGDSLNVCLNAFHAGSRDPDPAK